MTELKIQLLMDQAEALRETAKYSEAIKVYLKAVRGAGEIYKARKQDDLWIRKAISMASNGMGVCYAKLGFAFEAVGNFLDAEKHSPDEESRRLVRRNLDKLMEKVVDKTYVEGKAHDYGNRAKKCYCDEPECAKCLLVNCLDPDCKVHPMVRKNRLRNSQNLGNA